MFTENKEPNYPVKTLVKALEIIDILSKDPNNRGLGISELNRMMGLGKSTIHRILDTLAFYNYVEKSEETDRYKLSWGLFYVGHVVPKQNQLGNIDYQILADLSIWCGETVNIGVKAGNEVVIIAKYDGQASLKAGPEIGGREPLHATAQGKILICELDNFLLSKIFDADALQQFTPNTITRVENLLKEIEKVRQQGFAIDDEEYSLGLSCIAMPIRNYTGAIIAGLSVSAPSLRMNYSRLMEIKEELVLACKAISESLGSKRG